jgi:S-adenosylmethionine-diacylgycerolhomoserine-N-methlytransferase
MATARSHGAARREPARHEEVTRPPPTRGHGASVGQPRTGRSGRSFGTLATVTAPLEDLAAHRAFLNRFYGPSRLYDATRRFLLPGRDRALRLLLAEPWDSLIEIGPGTGRNLRQLHAGRPEARLGGLEASDAMLAHAVARCPFAGLRQGFVETADLVEVLGRRPSRILFSYSLSMIAARELAIQRARQALHPQGEVMVVDFADLGGLPAPLARALRAWLRACHVRPLDPEVAERAGAKVELGAGRYYLIARYGAA